jgi:prophage tail gpP-like protein
MAEAKAPEVTLKTDGKIYGGWKSIDIRRSIEFAANTFSLGITDRWAGQEVLRPIRMGSPCEVWIDEEKLVTGYVDDVAPRHSATERSIEVEGRSKIADLIDCALPPSTAAQFLNQDFGALARGLAKHFGIGVVDRVGAYKPAGIRNLDPGRRVFEALEEWSREEAVMLTTDANGNLVITRASSERVRTMLKLGENILSAQGRFSMKDRFSHYHVYAQRWANDDNFGGASAHISGRAEDLRVRFRPTVIVAEEAESHEAVRKRAEWQRNVQYGRSMQATYTVTGWRHADGLWAPNKLVRIEDEWMGLNGVWWIIATARFLLDEKGMRTELTVMPREAFDLVSLPPKDKKLIWQEAKQ